MELGSSQQDILNRASDTLIRLNQGGKLKEGSNMINTRMNGHDTTIRATFKNGELQSLNIMKGHSVPKKSWNVIDDF